MSLLSTAVSQCPFASSPSSSTSSASSPPISPSTSVSFLRANIPVTQLAASPPSYPIPASLPVYPRSHMTTTTANEQQLSQPPAASSPPSVTEISMSISPPVSSSPRKPPLPSPPHTQSPPQHTLHRCTPLSQHTQHQHQHQSQPQPSCYFYLSTRQQNTIERIIENTKNKKQETKKIYGNVVEYVTNKILDNGIYIQFIRGTPVTCIFNSQDIGTISLQRMNKYDYAYPIYHWHKIQRLINENTHDIFFLRIEEENDGIIDYYKIDAFDMDGNLLFPICFTAKENKCI